MSRLTDRAAGARLLWREAGPSLPACVALLAAAVLAFLSGGYIMGRSTPVVLAFLFFATILIWTLRTWRRPTALFAAALVAFTVFTLWAGLSVTWSIGPDLTWIAFNVVALYLIVVMFVGSSDVRAVDVRVAAWAFLGLVLATALWAMLGKWLPAVVTHAHEYSRLTNPVGYWNALALVMVMGLVTSLSLAGDGRSRLAPRLIAAGAAVPMVMTFVFCFSRGGIAILIVALVLYFAFTSTRLSSLWTLFAVTLPSAVAIWVVRDLDTLFANTTDAALRIAQGGVLLRWSSVALVVTLLLQAAVAILEQRVAWPRWSKVAAGAAALAIIMGGGAVFSAVYVSERGGGEWVRARVSGFVSDSDDVSVGNDAGRLASVTTGRPRMWREALDQSRYARVQGTGAGTFVFSHYRFRQFPGVIKHAHNQWLNVLSELGVPGLVVFAVAIVLLVAAAIGSPFTHRRDPVHPLLVACQVSAVAFFVHMSWDWDWDITAVGIAAFTLLGVSIAYRRSLLAAGSPPSVRTAHDEAGETGEAHVPQPSGVLGGYVLPRALATVILVTVALSWLAPYMAERAQYAAVEELGAGRAAAGLAHAQRAATLNPLAADSLLTQAAAYQQLGRVSAAAEALKQAVTLQPENYEAWYKLGVFQAEVLGRGKAARASLRRALSLNPGDDKIASELALVGG